MKTSMDYHEAYELAHLNHFPNDQHDSPRRQKSTSRHRIKEKPTWTAHYSRNPRHFVRDLADFTIPHAFPALYTVAPLEQPKKKGFWLLGYRNFIITYTEYEIDRQLRAGLPDLDSPRRYGRATLSMDGSLFGTDKFFSYAALMAAHEVEKAIRAWMRGYRKKHGCLPEQPVSISQANGDGHTMMAGALSAPAPASALRFVDLDARQQEFFVAALGKRLRHLPDENRNKVLIETDWRHGSLWDIGHVDLVEMAVSRNFKLDQVDTPPAAHYADLNGFGLDGDDEELHDAERRSSIPSTQSSGSHYSIMSDGTRWSDIIRTVAGDDSPTRDVPRARPEELTISRVLDMYTDWGTAPPQSNPETAGKLTKRPAARISRDIKGEESSRTRSSAPQNEYVQLIRYPFDDSDDEVSSDMVSKSSEAMKLETNPVKRALTTQSRKSPSSKAQIFKKSTSRGNHGLKEREERGR